MKKEFKMEKKEGRVVLGLSNISAITNSKTLIGKLRKLFVLD